MLALASLPLAVSADPMTATPTLLHANATYMANPA
jgi:hypothetical protein